MAIIVTGITPSIIILTYKGKMGWGGFAEFKIR
jgi:hypothetical protein